MNDKNEYELKELGNSKYEVTEGEADIRGWTVKNEQGKILGQVNDLLFDAGSEKVKFVLLDLSDNELHLAERKVMLPIELAKLDIAASNVIFPGIMANELSSIPDYEKGKTVYSTEIFSEIFKNRYNRDSESTFRNTTTTSGTSSAREQTVIGVFDYTGPAQSAVEYLTEHGFSRGDITIIPEGSAENTDMTNEKSNFFNSIFRNYDEAQSYSEATGHSCVVSVHTGSKQQAEQAAEILDNYGAVNMENRTRHHPVTGTDERKYHSMIIDNRS